MAKKHPSRPFGKNYGIIEESFWFTNKIIAMSLFEKHQPTITKAIKALHDRAFYAAFTEHPSPAVYGETADADGQAKFKASLWNKFDELKQTNPDGWAGQEESPYLQEPLKVSYPIFSTGTLIDCAKTSFHQWRKVSTHDRAGILMESLDR